MDLFTLASTAYIFAKPFLEKTGDGVVSKIGEDIWNLIKSPFLKKGDEDIEEYALTNQAKFTKEIEDKLIKDESFKAKLIELVNNANNDLNGQFNQQITNNKTVDKQINIQTNSGNIQM